VKERLDIVDRLRVAWTSFGDMANDERLEAAEEISRLRNLLAEQKSEAMTFHAENERLRTALRDWIAGTQTHAKRANEGGSR
jgi:regulator of replication initiation timing